MLTEELDTWCIHDCHINTEWINANYRGVIIGGAGLLHPCFNRFWHDVVPNLKVPLVIWGVGGCYPDNETADANMHAISTNVLRHAASRADLVNVRDEMSASQLGISNVNICACPTILYTRKFSRFLSPKCDRVLGAVHPGLISNEEQNDLAACIRNISCRSTWILNEQTRNHGLVKIIRKHYCISQSVVTTRLHGAIIAYGLGIPYVCVARDHKTREFHRLYGRGFCTDEIKDVPDLLRESLKLKHELPDCSKVLRFGSLVYDWLRSL